MNDELLSYLSVHTTFYIRLLTNKLCELGVGVYW